MVVISKLSIDSRSHSPLPMAGVTKINYRNISLCFALEATMNFCLSNQNPHWKHLKEWLISVFLPFSRQTGPSRKFKKHNQSCWLNAAQNQQSCSKEKGWVTSQWAAKRNRLLLLCMITVGTGLKGVFVCPGGSKNGMAWLHRVACGLV